MSIFFAANFLANFLCNRARAFEALSLSRLGVLPQVNPGRWSKAIWMTSSLVGGSFCRGTTQACAPPFISVIEIAFPDILRTKRATSLG